MLPAPTPRRFTLRRLARVLFILNLNVTHMAVNSSLDAHRQIVVAARGQTISVATYPQSGLVLWGSEQAACKAAINMLGEKHAKVATITELPTSEILGSSIHG